jgi:RNA polymerase sigma-70 factor (ECF subfamily)
MDSYVDRWVDKYADVLFCYALRRVRRRDIAEELVQDTFVAAIQGAEQFAGHSSEKTWLIGILRHKIVDHIRRANRTGPADPLDNDADPMGRQFDTKGRWNDTPGDWRSDPVAILSNRDFWIVFESCYSALPQGLAQTFALREMEDIETPRVCQTLGISESNLWVRLHRARLLLRECLEKNWFEEPV